VHHELGRSDGMYLSCPKAMVRRFYKGIIVKANLKYIFELHHPKYSVRHSPWKRCWSALTPKDFR